MCNLNINIMAVLSIYLDTRKKNSSDVYPVKFRIYHNKAFFISSGMYSNVNTWDNGEYGKKEPNYKVKNMALRSKYNLLESELLLLGGKLKGMSDKQLKEHLSNIISLKPVTSCDFLRYYDEYISLKDKKSTKDNYINTRKLIVEFDDAPTFETIDRKWLTSFNQFLVDKGYMTNYIGIHLKNIRAVFNYAIDEEVTTLYPFRKFKIKREQTRKRSLTIDELKLLKNYPCEEYLEFYRDIFMLIFYLIGINLEDLLFLTKDNLMNGRIEYYRHKTGKLFSIKVEPEAQSILDKYKGDRYLLNIMDNRSNYTSFTTSIDRALKQIGEVSILKRGKKIRNPLFPKLSTYWARHSWATLAAELDIPKETISAGLGHEIGSDVTSIYIKFDQKKVDDANRRVIDYLFGKEKAGE
jgi:site-specific recombinase XerD